jgi:excisionase family DNA binding protein
MVQFRKQKRIIQTYHRGNMQGDMLNIIEVAKVLSVSRSKVYRLIAEGALRGVQLTPTSNRKFHRSEIEQLAASSNYPVNWSALEKQ